MTRSTMALMLALAASACASAPIAPPPAPVEPPPSFEQKMSWILRLEDQRVLHDATPPAAAPLSVPVPVPTRENASPVAGPPPMTPDLLQLLWDGEARIRRRAALAVGRVGLADGVPGLVGLLRDADPEVRQMAAFALGLIGDVSARDSLIAALADPSPLMRGSAAEALGLIADPAAALPIARMASAILDSGAPGEAPSDATDAARDTPAAAFRLGLYALVRLKSYDAIASAALDAAGQPRVSWWPLAFALQRLEDQRALPALLTLVKAPHSYTRAFAAKGLGAMNDPSAVDALLPLLGGPDNAVAIEAIRALARLRSVRASPALLRLIQTSKTESHVRLEALTAIGSVGGAGAIDALIDLLGDPSPPMRAAAIRSLAQLDAEGFITILSGLDVDTDWTVRAALATLLGTLPPEIGLARLRVMMNDPEPRVMPAVLAAVAKLHPPDAAKMLIAQLSTADPVIRAAAANGLAELKAAEAVAPLADAYRRGLGDTTYVARAAALTALASFGAAAATPSLTAALADADWAVRVRAASLLKQLDPASDAAARIRPAPSAHPELYSVPRLTDPQVSIQAFIETARGTIQIELAVLDAPLTVENFVALARAGFFDGMPIHRVVPGFVIQGGDPRGDGEGGPGYSIRDELNERPFLRGTVGMALDWGDTGGSQFFITLSPQPHLDAKYTVFGRVIDGMDAVDHIEPSDVIRRVRIWDGTTPNSPQQ